MVNATEVGDCKKIIDALAVERLSTNVRRVLVGENLVYSEALGSHGILHPEVLGVDVLRLPKALSLH